MDDSAEENHQETSNTPYDEKRQREQKRADESVTLSSMFAILRPIHQIEPSKDTMAVVDVWQ